MPSDFITLKRLSYRVDIEDEIGLVGWIWGSNGRQTVWRGNVRVWLYACMHVYKRTKEIETACTAEGSLMQNYGL